MENAAIDLPDGITGDDVRQELARLLATDQFQQSPKLAEFLRFVVEQTLDGNQADLKAYTIGVDALGQREDFDQLAQASLAGHLLECGTQATGGNYTDWETVVESLPEAGYPMAEIDSRHARMRPCPS